uniref:GYF domain-containing protein n=1 Tax=Alexandrium monilatum TaxID=311494 RepID=A0A7S4Q984_9DINO|mmetsp:Transcript_58275/g.173426  ORF Transcript_58275/g.173426 Transcript_58275/m.173426 type:complete len:290 (-) Transcript_58275:248-1117(-)
MSLPSAEQPPPPPPQHAPFVQVTAAALASMAGDHGRKVHELPWLYLDSVGQEYGPVPGWTMREWLTLGRFPVGRDLRVRLPEWEQHLPLHQLFPDLSTAFVLPPAWPNIYVDEVLQGEEAEPRAVIAAFQAHQPAHKPAPDLEGSQEVELEGQAFGGSGSGGRCPSGSGSGSNQEVMGRWVPLPRLWMAGAGMSQQRPPHRERVQFGHERLMRQEEPILPPPPPQPSQQQLRELLSQPQEGPPLWEDDSSYQCSGAPQVHAAPFISAGTCVGLHSGDLPHHVWGNSVAA